MAAAVDHKTLTGGMCRLYSLCWCTCKGKIRTLMITTCRHSDISLDTQQWAVGHSPAERKRNRNLKGENGFSPMSLQKGKQIIQNLNAYFPWEATLLICLTRQLYTASNFYCLIVNSGYEKHFTIDYVCTIHNNSLWMQDAILHSLFNWEWGQKSKEKMWSQYLSSEK